MSVGPLLDMGDQIVVFDHAKGQLALRHADPEKEEAERQKRIQDALELEAKLKMINDTIPTRVYNTSSSSAGAGSGDFHQYRMVRRAEQQRIKRIEEDYKKKQELDEFEARKREREQQAQEQTAKRRKKRQKKKEKQASKKTAKTDAGMPGEGQAADKAGTESSSDSEGPQADLD